MAVPLPISLELKASVQNDHDAISSLLLRITAERGALRNVTESSLQEELALADSHGDVNPVPEVATKEPKDLQTRQKELDQARSTMIDRISVAHNQVLIALDLVSFLLKRDCPRQADLTMSPMLKELYPQGMLGFDALDTPIPDHDQLESERLTSIGWQYSSLHQGADALLKAASNLESEVGRETRYWIDLLSVRQKQWSLCRIPRQCNAIGVRFGFREAGPMFHARSLAVLKPNEIGDASLEQGRPTEPKCVRVRIQEGSRTLSDSFLAEPPQSATAIGDQIKQARNSVFEEELFHQVEIDARSLLAHGVKRVGDAIRVPVGDSDRHLTITLEPRTTQNPSMRPAEVDAGEAQTYVLAFRLLLTGRYHQRLGKRSRPPPPLSNQETESSEQLLLRALLEIIDRGLATKLGPLAGFGALSG